MTPAALATWLVGAIRLARFDGAAIAMYDGSAATARASFAVIWFLGLLYLFFIMILTGMDPLELERNMADAVGNNSGPSIPGGGAGDDIDVGDLILRILLGFFIGWLGFLVLVHGFLSRSAIVGKFPTLMAAYNWTLLIRKALELLPAGLVFTGLVEPDLFNPILLISVTYGAAILYFVARRALAVGRLEAVLLLFLEQVVFAVVFAAVILPAGGPVAGPAGG